MASGVFDLIGPVMVGPSSSHTAGVARMANLAARILGSIPVRAQITFYNSFATTYKGHGSDKAICGGLLGFLPDDPKIRDAQALAEQAGMVVTYTYVGNASQYHPNSILMQLTDAQDKSCTVLGESLGGGVINIPQINGFKASLDGNLHTVIIEAEDKPGVIALITEVLSADFCNIATMVVSRKSRAGTACHVIEIDSPPRQITLAYLSSLPWANQITSIPPLNLL
jgi:L-serine dehydratase